MDKILRQKLYNFYFNIFIYFILFVVTPNLIYASSKSNIKTSPYTIVLLPDTQFYNELFGGSRTHIFDSQTQWIASHVNDLNIKLVLHLGDIVEHGTAPLYKNAKESLSYLDGIVPYIFTIGNHDIFWVKYPRHHHENKNNYRDFLHRAFPINVFNSRPSFGGVLKKDAIENSYHFFKFGTTEYMVITVEHRPKKHVLDWANETVAKFPNKEVIVLTHEYVEKGNTLVDPYGKDVWEKLVRKHKNIKFVFSGHVKGPGRLIGKGDHGNKIFQIGSNYQFEDNGGNGFLRLLKFYSDENKIMVKTYSPLLNEFKTDAINQFSINLDKSIFSNELLEKQTTKLEGNIKKKYKNGDILGEWNYKNGLLNGPTKLFYPNGKLKMVKEFLNHIPTTVSTYYANGQINFSGRFVKGKLEGLVKKFHANGQLMYSSKLIDTKFNGLRNLFYSNGQLEEEKIFTNNMALGKVKRYYPSGVLKDSFSLKEECMLKRCTGKIDGILREYFENGKPKSIITYVRDYEDGPAQFFSKKGYLKQERFFNRNKTDGLLNEFFQNGNLKSTQYVTNKLIQKYSLIFHQKGGLRTVFNIKDNNQMELLMNIMLKVNLSQNQITSMEYKKGFLRSLTHQEGSLYLTTLIIN